MKKSEIKPWHYSILRICWEPEGTLVYLHDRADNMVCARECAEDALQICDSALILHEGIPLQLHKKGKVYSYIGKEVIDFDKKGDAE